jgi:WYL domain-containing protein
MPEQQTRSEIAQELTNGERLVRAILEHRVVELDYQGYRRTVEPYLLGLHEAGEPILLGYQTAGFSHSGEIPGWRTFITTAIGDVTVTERTFAGPRSDWNPFGEAMLEIFARA